MNPSIFHHQQKSASDSSYNSLQTPIQKTVSLRTSYEKRNFWSGCVTTPSLYLVEVSEVTVRIHETTIQLERHLGTDSDIDIDTDIDQAEAGHSARVQCSSSHKKRVINN